MPRIDWCFCAVSLAEAKHHAHMAAEVVRLLKEDRGNEGEAIEYLKRLKGSVDAAISAAERLQDRDTK